MKFFVAILLIVSVALVGVSHPFQRLRRSRIVLALLSGGWLHVGMGVLLGPSVIGAVDEAALTKLTPFLAIGLGWIGVTVGLQARRDVLRELPWSLYRCAAIDIAASVAVFGVLSWLILGMWTPDASLALRWPPVALLTTASIGWLLETRSLRASPSAAAARLSLFVRGSGALCAMAAVLLFGLLVHATVRQPDGTMVFDWANAAVKASVALLLAVMTGLIGRFALRLAGGDRSELLVIFLGLVALVAGSAVALGYSPILASALAGAVIANLAGRELRRFERFILQAEYVVATLFSILAGMMLDVRIGLAGAGLATAIAAGRYFIKSPVFELGVRGRLFRPVDTDTDREPVAPASSPLYLAPIRQAPLAIALGVAMVISEASPMARKLLGVIVLTGVLSSTPLVFAAMRSSVRWEHESKPSPGRAEPASDAGATEEGPA
ncbi:MAG: cation:proton antiporter [Phycisphaeraceae bacterium]|nr:cation:proton antiporter [Phycisphaeraceae bacterium]